MDSLLAILKGYWNAAGESPNNTDTMSLLAGCDKKNREMRRHPIEEKAELPSSYRQRGAISLKSKTHGKMFLKQVGDSSPNYFISYHTTP
jgi:hypothetical protein